MATVCSLFTTSTVRRFTARSSVGIDNYESILDIGSANFTAGRNYVVVIQGYADAQGPIPSIGSIPFFSIYSNGSWPASTPLSIRGTVRTQGGSSRIEVMPFLGSYPSGTFLTDQAMYHGVFNPTAGVCYVTVLVWDLTELTAQSIPWFLASSGSTFPFAVRGSPASTLTSGTLSATGDWILFDFASFAPNAGSSSENNAANVWVECPASTRIYSKDAIVLSPPGNIAASFRNQYSVGNVMSATFPATDLWIKGIDDVAVASGGQTQLVKATLFAVKQDAKLMTISTPSTAGTVLSFYSNTFPWDGNSKDLIAAPTYYYSEIIIGRAHAHGPTLGSARSSSIQVEVDGEQIGGNAVAESTHAGYGNSLGFFVPHHRIGLFSHGGGRHYITVRGGTNAGLPQTTVPDDGYDVQLIAFSGKVGIIPAIVAPESPGPATPITISKETSVPLSSLPALPYEPDWKQAITVEAERRDFTSDTGYSLTSPKFTKAIEGADLVWANRLAGEADALVSFLTSLSTSGGAFRWRPPWEASDVAWSVEAVDFEDQNPSQRGLRTIRAQARRLVHIVP